MKKKMYVLIAVFCLSMFATTACTRDDKVNKNNGTTTNDGTTNNGTTNSGTTNNGATNNGTT
ncbi:MAG TPA: hypothetical protein DCE48_11885, partial [Lachnospiraceae bacterium]|nr:hypothetical protein [Lachnospiraceae bacterium]